MLYLSIAVLVVLSGYIIASIIKGRELPVSLSDTYYLWPKWVFPTVMIVTGFGLLPCWLEVTEGHPLQFLVFLSCAGFVFVGAAPNFRNDKLEYSIHTKAGYTAAFASILALSFVMYEWWYPFYVTALLFLIFFRNIKTHYIFLLELAILESVIGSVLCALK
jgi:hypothetical protein